MGLRSPCEHAIICLRFVKWFSRRPRCLMTIHIKIDFREPAPLFGRSFAKQIMTAFLTLLYLLASFQINTTHSFHFIYTITHTCIASWSGPRPLHTQPNWLLYRSFLWFPYNSPNGCLETCVLYFMNKPQRKQYLSNRTERKTISYGKRARIFDNYRNLFCC